MRAAPITRHKTQWMALSCNAYLWEVAFKTLLDVLLDLLWIASLRQENDTSKRKRTHKPLSVPPSLLESVLQNVYQWVRSHWSDNDIWSFRPPCKFGTIVAGCRVAKSNYAHIWKSIESVEVDWIWAWLRSCVPKRTTLFVMLYSNIHFSYESSWDALSHSISNHGQWWPH